MKRVGVLAHPTRPMTAPVAEQIASTLAAWGVSSWVFAQWDEGDVEAQIADTDMVIAIGGDGAMLRSARVCAPHNVPVLGLNMGHLGFLTEIKGPDNWEHDLKAVLEGHYWIETRMMLRARVFCDHHEVATGVALNDVVINRGIQTHMIRMNMYIDGDWTTTYNADALIIATATGSTAYGLAAGGPILPPELRNILVVPVAPHLSLDRPIVLPEGATVDVVPAPDTQQEMGVAVDGEGLTSVGSGDRVQVQACDYVSHFIRLRARNYFYRSLLDRLEPRIIAPEENLSVDDGGKR
jgi:NAD+ kinase